MHARGKRGTGRASGVVVVGEVRRAGWGRMMGQGGGSMGDSQLEETPHRIGGTARRYGFADGFALDGACRRLQLAIQWRF